MGFLDDFKELNEKVKEIDAQTGREGSGWVIIFIVFMVIALIFVVIGGGR